ncbi:hypothetical protein CPHO_08515 [Corynebacterium phocae]|uniref:Helix-turn-helix domain-containing protein n=1 Tax=Corynebacterium phocae TaxID=161895 RepID=A0A1L7D4I4_9CORY|nr:helix-turn-helix domain-containing protein [Corynebacterium phocae]APT92921.1 hypothetical protein CPHO_08515 [Corynebacterium phocae]KAA8723251.1 helix-turn-helix domain-containing protein [Corynebacterium phocae]
MTQPTRLLTVHEVADYLGIHHITVNKMLNTGEIVGFKLTDKHRSPWRITPQAVQDYIERRTAA